jgi:DNA-binding MarR family transcriptional regulator
MTGPYYSVEHLQPERSVGFLIKRCGVLMGQIAERAFQAHSISFNQWIILIMLTQRDHASPSELSAYMGHDMGALTRLVDELTREGLVIRERNEHDRRAVQIAITPEGRRLAQAGKRIIVELLNELVEPYSTAEVDAMISLLQRFLARMQEFAKVSKPAVTPAPTGLQSTTGRHPAMRTGAKGRRRPHGAPRRKATE